jgi:hypothetical protein
MYSQVRMRARSLSPFHTRNIIQRGAGSARISNARFRISVHEIDKRPVFYVSKYTDPEMGIEWPLRERPVHETTIRRKENVMTTVVLFLGWRRLSAGSEL